MDLVVSLGNSGAGPWEHSETVFDHDAILGVIWVMVAGHAAFREVSQTAWGLRRERGVVFVVGKQEESSEAPRSREDGAVVVMVSLENEPERDGFLSL
jgi:hypothetical protein